MNRNTVGSCIWTTIEHPCVTGDTQLAHNITEMHMKFRKNMPICRSNARLPKIFSHLHSQISIFKYRNHVLGFVYVCVCVCCAFILPASTFAPPFWYMRCRIITFHSRLAARVVCAKKMLTSQPTSSLTIAGLFTLKMPNQRISATKVEAGTSANRKTIIVKVKAWAGVKNNRHIIIRFSIKQNDNNKQRQKELRKCSIANICKLSDFGHENRNENFNCIRCFSKFVVSKDRICVIPYNVLCTKRKLCHERSSMQNHTQLFGGQWSHWSAWIFLITHTQIQSLYSSLMRS